MRVLFSVVVFIVLLMLTVASTAQNYSLINPNRQYFFEDGNCIRIDSIAVNNADTEYYNYKQISNPVAIYILIIAGWGRKWLRLKMATGKLFLLQMIQQLLSLVYLPVQNGSQGITLQE